MKCQFAIRDLLWLSLLVASWLTFWLDALDELPKAGDPAIWVVVRERLHIGPTNPIGARMW